MGAAPRFGAVGDRTGRHRPIPRTGDLRSDRRADRARAGSRIRGVPERAIQHSDVELSDAPALSVDPRLRRLPERVGLPTRQLHALPAAEPVLRERALWAGSAAAAGRVRAAPDHRGLRRRGHATELDDAVSAAARPERVRQLPGPALRDHAQSGDGQLPGHRRQYADAAERELRPRNAAAVLHRHR